MYLTAVLIDGKRERIHAPGFTNIDEAVNAFALREGVYEGPWCRVDAPGTPRLVRYDQIVRVTGNAGPSHID